MTLTYLLIMTLAINSTVQYIQASCAILPSVLKRIESIKNAKNETQEIETEEN